MNGCPYLEINDFNVVCKAQAWGKALDGSPKYAPLPRSLIYHCSSSKYPECTTYKRKRAEDVREENWPDIT